MTRLTEIDRQLASLRARHPELADRLTWTSLQRVLEREEIVVLKKPIREKARMRAMGGVGVLTFNSSLPPREWLFAGAHEYAHWVLHHDTEPTRHGFVSYRRDRREPEADYLAEWLLRGPDAHPAPTLKESWVEPVRSRPRRPAPRVLPATVRRTLETFGDPYADLAPTVPARLTPRYGGREGETPLQRAMRQARPLRREMKSGSTSDHGIITHSPGRVRYIDREGREWTVWDVAIRDGVRVHVPAGVVDARLRYFVNASGGRRKYVFEHKRELRDVAERHFERQLREADVVHFIGIESRQSHA